MRWDKGYEATYYMTIVDPLTWRDIGRLDITGGTVQRVPSGLMHSADIDTTAFEYGETWARIYLDARQGESSAHIPLITGLTSSPTVRHDGVRVSQDVQIYSVLKPLEDLLLPRGWYAGVNTNGADIIKTLLRTPAPVEINGDAPFLAEPIIAEENETYLSMVEKILQAINWRIRLHGDGTIELTEKAANPIAHFDPAQDYIEPDVSIEADWFECPNVFRATSGNVSATAIDEDPNSILSVPSRGREVWKEETASDFNDGETIAEYAQRRLKEEQSYATTARYFRRYVPDLYPSDMVSLRYQEIQGTYTIESQTIELSHSARTNEEVRNG